MASLINIKFNFIHNLEVFYWGIAKWVRQLILIQPFHWFESSYPSQIHGSVV